MAADDYLQSITQGNNQYVLIALLALAALALLLFLNRNTMKQWWLNFKTRRQLDKLGLEQIADFKCPDELDDYFVIDRLIMCSDGISVIVFKQYPGIIFCADSIDEWSQILDGKSYKFKNPLYDLEYQVKAVSAYVPGVPVNGFLFFDHQADFPKGHPDRVIQINCIPQSLKPDKHDTAESTIESAWEKLKSMVN